MKIAIEKKSDWVGIVASVGCIVHCMLMPLVLNWLVVTSHDSVWPLDYLFWALSCVAVYFSARNSRSNWIKLAFVLLLVAVFVSITLEDRFDFMPYALYAASGLLALTHYINLKKFNSHSCKH